jgi:hypothetical protein
LPPQPASISVGYLFANPGEIERVTLAGGDLAAHIRDEYDSIAALKRMKVVKLAMRRAPLYVESSFGDSTAVVFL